MNKADDTDEQENNDCVLNAAVKYVAEILY